MSMHVLRGLYKQVLASTVVKQSSFLHQPHTALRMGKNHPLDDRFIQNSTIPVWKITAPSNGTSIPWVQEKVFFTVPAIELIASKLKGNKNRKKRLLMKCRQQVSDHTTIQTQAEAQTKIPENMNKQLFRCHLPELHLYKGTLTAMV